MLFPFSIMLERLIMCKLSLWLLKSGYGLNTLFENDELLMIDLGESRINIGF